ESHQRLASPSPFSKEEGSTRVMPAAERVLAQQGLDARDVEPTGPGGRILKEDVERAAAEAREAAPAPQRGQALPAAPAAPAAGGEEEVVPMTLLRRRIAERLVAAQQTAALLTTFNEVDMSAVMALRQEHQEAFQKRYGIKLGFMSFFVKAAVDALKLIPAVNAEIRGDSIVYKNYYDIGVAVGGGRGLVVPVIRGADRLSFAEIEQVIADFGKRARENAIRVEELQGGTFTISNGGIYGSMLSTPIVNPPQSGILGMHAIQERPVVRDGQVVVRPMMYLALTYDHRIVDGREAVTFLRRIKDVIETPARMLLEV
ncbi:MAG TPA: 2-oxoglutarate dehydrogenase complex dihydrolipoyllysine-residue succinyltransferase, partial [Thermodesulfobacteriota bacterium]